MAQRKRVKSSKVRTRRAVPVRSLFTFPSEDEIGRREYEQLFDFSPAMYVLLDSAGIVTHINRAGALMLGMESRRVLGLPLRFAVAETQRRSFLDHFAKARRSDEVIETDLEFQTRHAGPISVRIYTRRALHGGRRLFPTIAIDIGEHLVLERAREAAERDRDRAERDREIAQASDAAKDHLIAVVSHELRNPLSPALVAADGLVHTLGMPPGTRELATVIKRNIELEARLIDDLLDFARITRGRLNLRPKTVDVHEVLLEAIRTCEPEARRRGVTISHDWQAYHHYARADEGRLRQVFWNLLNNAIKFSHSGDSISVRTTSDDEAWCRVAIRDRGVGMDDVRVAGLFRPFADSPSPGEQRRGLGLGLTICHGIIEGLGGRIWAASEGPGHGSLFTVELPTVPMRDVVLEPDPPHHHASHVLGFERPVQHVEERRDPEDGEGARQEPVAAGGRHHERKRQRREEID